MILAISHRLSLKIDLSEQFSKYLSTVSMSLRVGYWGIYTINIAQYAIYYLHIHLISNPIQSRNFIILLLCLFPKISHPLHSEPGTPLLLLGTASFSRSYQRWLIRQSLLISDQLLCPWLFSSLLCSPAKQQYLKQIIPGFIGIKMLFSLQIFTTNIKK